MVAWPLVIAAASNIYQHNHRNVPQGGGGRLESIVGSPADRETRSRLTSVLITDIRPLSSPSNAMPDGGQRYFSLSLPQGKSTIFLVERERLVFNTVAI